jgi:hypothetical protein
LGEKVADRPDEGAFVAGSIPKMVQSSRLSSQFHVEYSDETPRGIRCHNLAPDFHITKVDFSPPETP